MDFELSPELLALQAEAQDVGRAAAAQADLTEDTWIAAPDRTFSLELGKRGWLGMTWPVEAGGGGRSPLERFVVFEALIGDGAPLATSWFADRQMGPTLLQFGTAEQQRTHLPAILDGTSAWSIGMSEPDAGSDVASIRTRAERDGDDFVVNGQKIWNSGRRDGRLDLPHRPHRPRRAAARRACRSSSSTCARPGISIVPIKDMTGSDHFCEVFFEDVRVPAENLVGELNGSFRQVMRQMEHERGGIDRLLSNRKLYVDVLPLADTTRPARPPGDRRHRDRLPHRPAARAARGARPGAQAVLGRHQDVLHRARAAHRRVLRRRRSGPPRCSPSRASRSG